MNATVVAHPGRLTIDRPRMADIAPRIAVVANRGIQESHGYIRGRTLANWGMACGIGGLAFFAWLALAAVLTLIQLAHH